MRNKSLIYVKMIENVLYTIISPIAIIFVLSTNLHSHHALEYIDVESYSIAQKNQAVFYLRHDYYVEDKRNAELDHWEITPGVSYGFFKYLMGDIHIHLSKFGTGFIKDGEEVSPFFEAFATSLITQITKYKSLPIDIAMSFIYEYPFKRARELIGGKQAFEVRLILSRDFLEHSNITLNLYYSIEEGIEHSYGWMFGTKHPLTSDMHGISGGLELNGDFNGKEIAFLPGIYIPISQNSRLKVGFGLGLNDDGERLKRNLRSAIQFMYVF